jgi:predicted ATPase
MKDADRAVNHTVFLSYASADRARALAVADALEAAGVAIWIDRRGIAGGAVWIEAIARAVREARVVLVLCSAASVVSRNVRQELQLAWDRDTPILPLLLEPVAFPDGIAYVLHGRQWIELSGRPVEAWLPDVLRALAAAGDAAQPESAAPEREIPATTASRPPSVHLPTPPNALVGRDAEVAAIAALVEARRLVTLTGPGGTGKTRLAIEVAARVARRFPDGVFFVDLAPLTDPAQVLATIAQACGVREAAGRTLRDGLAAYFASRRILLLLDKFEHLLAGARTLADLLAVNPDVHLLVTSRALLRLRAEHEVAVPPLAAAPATALFVERAQAANPAFAPTPDNLGTVAEVCRHLDGLPLAIELAAARMRLLTPPQLLARLERRLPTLTGGARDLPARQQTLRDAIAWSHDLLTPQQQLLFRRLAVFAGGCTFAAAEAVGNRDGDVDPLNDLSALVEMSLVRQDDAGDEPRYRMLETIREFGLEQLRASDGEPAIRQAHAAWCLALAEEAVPHLIGPGEERWVDRLEAEHANLRAALAWSEETGAREAGLRLAAAAWVFWFMRGHWGEGVGWLERALEPGEATRTVARARALGGLGALVLFRGDDARAVVRCEESLGIAREVGDAILERGALTCLGLAAASRGDYGRATQIGEENLALSRAGGDRVGESIVLANLARVARLDGDGDRAARLAEEALRLQRELGYTWGAAGSLFALGDLARDRGDHAPAVACYLEGLDLAWAHRDRRLIAQPLEGLAIVAAAGGQPERAVRLLGAVDRLRETLGAPLIPDEPAAHARALAAVRAALAEDAFRAAWTAGRTLSPEAILAEAHAVRDRAEPVAVISRVR